jgi:hypothetical protein
LKTKISRLTELEEAFQAFQTAFSLPDACLRLLTTIPADVILIFNKDIQKRTTVTGEYINITLKRRLVYDRKSAFGAFSRYDLR